MNTENIRNAADSLAHVTHSNQGNLRPVRVWDIPTRLFHWTLVGLVGFLWWTGENGPIENHMLAGYAVLALILWRLIYGVVGSTTARFSDFVKGPGAVIRYLKSAFGKNTLSDAKDHVLGHNPAGGWMVMVLLLILLAQASTGLFANDDIFSEGPLATMVSKETSDMLTRWHKGILFPALQVLVGLHVLAAFFYLFAKGENLIRAMVTGKKAAPPEAGKDLRFASPLVALAVAVVAGAVVWYIVEVL